MIRHHFFLFLFSFFFTIIKCFLNYRSGFVLNYKIQTPSLVFLCAPLSLSWANQSSPGFKRVGTVVQAVQVIACFALGIAEDISFQPVSCEPIAASHVISTVQDQF